MLKLKIKKSITKRFRFYFNKIKKKGSFKNHLLIKKNNKKKRYLKKKFINYESKN